MRDQLFSLALLLCALHSACGLYFHISETERKCFIEEVPDETTVIGECQRPVPTWNFSNQTSSSCS